LFSSRSGGSSSGQPTQQVAPNTPPPPSRPNFVPPPNRPQTGPSTPRTPRQNTTPRNTSFSKSSGNDAFNTANRRSESDTGEPEQGSDLPGFAKNKTPFGDDQKPTISAPIGWNAQVDPPLAELMYDTSGKVKGLNVKLGSGISDEVLLPKCFSPYLSFQLGKSFVVYDMRTGSRKSKSQIQFDFFAKPALSPQAGYFATTTGTFGKGGVAVYDVAERESLGTISIEGVKEIMFPSDQQLLVITEKTARMIELPSGKTEYEVPIESIGYFDKTKTTLSPGGRYLAIFRLKSKFGDSTPQIETYDLKTQQKLPSLEGPEFDLFVANPTGVSFSQDGKHLAAGVAAQKQGRIFVWNFQTGELEKDITLVEEYDRLQEATGRGNDDERGLAWFPDKKRLLFKGHGVVDLEVGELVYLIPPAKHRNSFRWPVSESQVVGIAGDIRGASMITVDLPVELFDKARDVITAGGLAVDTLLPPITIANTETGIPLQLPTGPWNAKPDPAPVAEAPLIRDMLEFKLPRGEGYFSQFFLSDASAGKALVTRKTQENKFRFYGEPIVFKSWLELYELNRGKEIDTMELPYPSDSISFSPSGNLVVTRDAERQDRLDIWNPAEESHYVGFRPFIDLEPEGPGNHQALSDYGEWIKPHQQVKAARLLDDTHLITLSGENRLRAWKLPACELIYEIKEITVPGVSPGNNILAIQDSDHVMLFESRTGKPLGLLSVPGEMTSAGFHTNGELFAVTVLRGADNFLYAWNLNSGEQIASFPLPRPTSSLRFADENHVLLDNRYLVNLPSEAVAWNYEFPDQTMVPFNIDDRIVFFGPLPQARQPTIYLTAVNLPDDSLKQRIQAANLSSESIPLEGKSVSVVANISEGGGGNPGSQSVRAQAAAHYTQILEDRGSVVKPNGLFQLVLNTEEKAGRTVTYNRRSDPFSGSSLGPSLFREPENNTESASVRNITCSLTIEEDGLPVWQTSSTFSNYSMFVLVQANSSIQETLDKQLTGRVGSYFQNTPIPTFVFPPGAEAGLGTSKLNEEGLNEQ
ncbi:MAG: WD40 repeat domain-containing protein, partial [Planctomycetaceae bacterium]|nr:WD40 repeat domain-containing protein [Planctomycetaceae bacterium]